MVVCRVSFSKPESLTHSLSYIYFNLNYFFIQINRVIPLERYLSSFNFVIVIG